MIRAEVGVSGRGKWLAAGVGLLLCAANVQAADGLKLSNAVFQEVQVTAADGTITHKTVSATNVVPGTEVIYVISYDNTGGPAAENVVITNPIPVDLRYVDAQGAPAVSGVSVDHGKSFAALASLTVPGADGKPRAAQAADATDLRWVIDKLPSGGKGSVSFKAQVK